MGVDYVHMHTSYFFEVVDYVIVEMATAPMNSVSSPGTRSARPVSWFVS